MDVFNDIAPYYPFVKMPYTTKRGYTRDDIRLMNEAWKRTDWLPHERETLNQHFNHVSYLGNEKARKEQMKPLYERYEAQKELFDRKIDKTTAYVYLFHNEVTNLHKIGFSSHPMKRFRTIMIKRKQLMSIEHLIPTPDPEQREAELHFMFRDKNIEGEWFDLSEDDLQDIKDMK
jgi:hypothetical protein